MKKYIGIDFGGTNLRIGGINPDDGSLVGKVREFPTREIS